MLKRVDNLLCYLITGLGIAFLAFTPLYTDGFFAPGGVEFMGAVLFLVFLGLLNFTRIKSGRHSARTVAILANVLALTYVSVVVIILRESAAIGVGLLVLALCCTSWMNHATESALDAKDTKRSHIKVPVGIDPSLLHLEEYKALHEEMKMCQHEMHRTWLWASAAAAAVYTVLYTPLPSDAHLPQLVWSMPPVILFFCFIRYLVFWFRIKSLADYQCQLEEATFDIPKEGTLLGLARYNRDRLQQNALAFLKDLFRSPEACIKWMKSIIRYQSLFTFMAGLFWLALIGFSCWLAYSKPNDAPKGPAYRHEREFRQQIKASIPVEKWRYGIHNVRFTDDFKKALVVFHTPGKSVDVVFEDDGFHRYQGKAVDLDRQVANRSTNLQDWCQSIVVTLPDR